MSTATQAEIAATPVSAQPVDATPNPAPAAAAPAETPSPAAPVNVMEYLFGDAPTETPAASETAPVATPAPEAKPATETPADATPSEKPAGETPPVEEKAANTELTTEPDKALPNRISTKQFRTKDEQDALLIKHEYEQTGDPIDLREAFRILDARKQEAQAAAAQTAEEAAATPDPIATLENEVQALRTKFRESSDGSLNSTELAELQIELADKTADLKVEKLRREQRQTASEALANADADTKFTESRQRALGEYPTVADNETLLGVTFAAELNAWKSPNHPKHAELRESDAPERVTSAAADKAAGILAKQLGISKEQALASLRAKPAAPTPAPPATVAPAPIVPAAPEPAAGKVTTTPGNRGVPATATQPTAQDVLKQSLTDPKFDRMKYLFPDDSEAVAIH